MKKITILCFFLSTLTTYSIKIDRVILSTTVNQNYIEFWPLVARAWRDFIGIKPTLALISEFDVPINKTLGDVIRFNPIPGIKASHQAQMIRMLLPILFEHEVCLISDIDMLPLDKSFFTTQIQKIPDDKFIIFNGKGYSKSNSLKNLTRIPMCYTAAKGSLYKKIFKINSPDDFQKTLLTWGYNAKHSSDELLLLQCINSWDQKLIRSHFLNNCIGRFSGRRIYYIPYNKTTLKHGKFVDFHMHAVMPLRKHLPVVQEITEGAGFNINFDTIAEEINNVIPFYDTNDISLQKTIDANQCIMGQKNVNN